MGKKKEKKKCTMGEIMHMTKKTHKNLIGKQWEPFF